MNTDIYQVTLKTDGTFLWL